MKQPLLSQWPPVVIVCNLICLLYCQDIKERLLTAFFTTGISFFLQKDNLPDNLEECVSDTCIALCNAEIKFLSRLFLYFSPISRDDAPAQLVDI